MNKVDELNEMDTEIINFLIALTDMQMKLYLKEYEPTTQDKPTTSTNGAHTHSVTTNASTTGGQSANHVHTVPAHNTNANGSGSAMSIMPPYKAVYIWERIA